MDPTAATMEGSGQLSPLSPSAPPNLSRRTSPTQAAPLVALRALIVVFTASGIVTPAWSQTVPLQTVGPQLSFEQQIRPLLVQHCFDCHSTEISDGELDLQRFTDIDGVKGDIAVWLQVVEQLSLGEMPPRDVSQLSDQQREQLLTWARDVIDQVALENAGDPGPISLRRLSNWEYTYSVRDLTGVPMLTPANDFPLDGAAGEGFTNAAAALVMSPTLLNRYLDAAKEISQHAVLVPSGIAFSPSTSSSDWALERLAAIRELYGRYSADEAGTQINLQGVIFDVNGRGHLPIADYIGALTAARQELSQDAITIDAVAAAHGLSPRYLQRLYDTLNAPIAADDQGVLIDPLRQAWLAGDLTLEPIRRWQQALWRFASVGHIGKVNGPQRWQEAIHPLTNEQTFRIPLAAQQGQDTITIDLITHAPGQTTSGAVAVWHQPRLITGGPDQGSAQAIPLAEVASRWQQMTTLRQQALADTAQYLAAAHWAQQRAQQSAEPIEIASVLAAHPDLNRQVLDNWFQLLGVSAHGQTVLGDRIDRKLEQAGQHESVQGWVGDDALSVLANISDEDVRIPGLLRAHGVAVHPSPSRSVVLAWQSPIETTVEVLGQLIDADTNCGNGFEWALQIRRGQHVEGLGHGVSQGAQPIDFSPQHPITVRPGDAIAVVVSARDFDHVCDCTAIEWTIRDQTHVWDLAGDVADQLLAANPHPDQYGHAGVWWFASEPATANLATAAAIPPGSLLASWNVTEDDDERRRLAEEITRLLTADSSDLPSETPDATLRQRLRDFRGDLFGNLSFGDVSLESLPPSSTPPHNGMNSVPRLSQGGIDEPREQVDAGPSRSDQIAVRGNSRLTVTLPAEWASGMELVADARLHPDHQQHAYAQMSVAQRSNEPGAVPTQPIGHIIDTSDSMLFDQALQPGMPILAASTGPTGQRLLASFDRFRDLFPIALCYPDIIPVDEVVTLRLYYREDDHLQRLMLDEHESAELDRLWDELIAISHAPLKLVDAFEQLYQYATQDADPSAFEPLREPIHAAAEQFRLQIQQDEPNHIRAVIELAERAWRQPLRQSQHQAFHDLYDQLRQQGLDHEAAVRLMLVRVFVAPAFLYRGEQPQPGPATTPIDGNELATRLSYFLWSSTPDQELAAVASLGHLTDPAILQQQARRMMADERIDRWALEFGCQWLMVRDLDTLDEKSDRHFPTFLELRSDMQEEVVRFFADMIRHDRSILSLLDADHSFMNPALAEHYGLELPAGQWQRVDGLRLAGRGGILGFAATLAKQSGASRTSPILRGTWLTEVVLGEHLPPPPLDIPQLPDEIPEGLTERQLTELHSSAASCATCHVRIDPWGFALEGFDAIGRYRTADAAGVAIDSQTVLPDGTPLDGLASVRDYLLEKRQDDFVRQFCRKLLGYALGRSVQLSDKPLVDEMMKQLAATDYRIGVAIDCIVSSPQFQNVRGQDHVDSSH